MLPLDLQSTTATIWLLWTYLAVLVSLQVLMAVESDFPSTALLASHAGLGAAAKQQQTELFFFSPDWHGGKDRRFKLEECKENQSLFLGLVCLHTCFWGGRKGEQLMFKDGHLSSGVHGPKTSSELVPKSQFQLDVVRFWVHTLVLKANLAALGGHKYFHDRAGKEARHAALWEFTWCVV